MLQVERFATYELTRACPQLSRMIAATK
jgi:hypothetical protein